MEIAGCLLQHSIPARMEFERGGRIDLLELILDDDPTAKSAKDAKIIAAMLCGICGLCGEWTHEKPEIVYKLLIPY